MVSVPITWVFYSSVGLGSTPNFTVVNPRLLIDNSIVHVLNAELRTMPL